MTAQISGRFGDLHAGTRTGTRFSSWSRAPTTTFEGIDFPRRNGVQAGGDVDNITIQDMFADNVQISSANRA